MGVTFKDNRVEVKKALNEKGIKFLNQAKEILTTQTIRNTPTGSGDLKRSFTNDSYVDEGNLKAYVGSSLEHSIWVELGTGEHAVNGDGRKGGWWIPVGDGKDQISLNAAKKYGWDKVRKDKNGNITFVFTYGMKPKRMLYKAFQVKGQSIQDRANAIYKEMND